MDTYFFVRIIASCVPKLPWKLLGDFPGTSLPVDFKSVFPEVPRKVSHTFPDLGSEKKHKMTKHVNQHFTGFWGGLFLCVFLPHKE